MCKQFIPQTECFLAEALEGCFFWGIKLSWFSILVLTDRGVKGLLEVVNVLLSAMSVSCVILVYSMHENTHVQNDKVIPVWQTGVCSGVCSKLALNGDLVLLS